MEEDNGNLAARCEALLRPIRDMTANWEVDVVALLSEYMSSLGVVMSAPDDKREREEIDFKEAALIVEGSACVYTKKVDHLYGLVIAAADMIYAARGKSLSSKDGAFCRNDETDDAVGDIIDFLVLDDVLEEGFERQSATTLPVKEKPSDEELNRLAESTCLMPIPLHLLPPKPQSRQSTNCNPSVSGIRLTDAVIQNDTGMLLLDGIGLETDVSSIAHGRDLSNHSTDDESVDNDFEPNCLDAECEIEPENCRENTVAPIERRSDFSIAVRSEQRSHFSASSLPYTEDVRRNSADPFTLLNPHQKDGFQERPLRKGRTWKKLELREESAIDLSLAVRKDVTNTGGLPVFVEHSSLFFTSKSNKFVSISRFLRHMRRRLRKQNALNRQGAEVGTNALRENLHACDSSDSESDIGEPGHDIGEMDFESAYATHGTYGSEADKSRSLSAFPLDSIQCGFEAQGQSSDPKMDMLHDESVAARMALCYEEACREYVQQTSSLWQAHVSDTFLEDRVSNWRAKIEPLLELEETRPEFDIEGYGTCILGKFSEISCDTTYRDSKLSHLLGNEEQFEVCRNFLAILQLFNNQKVDIAECLEYSPTLDPEVRLLDGVHAKRLEKSAYIGERALQQAPGKQLCVADATPAVDSLTGRKKRRKAPPAENWRNTQSVIVPRKFLDLSNIQEAGQ